MALPRGAPAAPARRAVEATLLVWGFADGAADALLVTTELVQNIAQHTPSGGELRLLLQPASILIEAVDADPTLPQLRDLDVHRAGGRGLLLVAAVSLTWGCRNTTWEGHAGKVIWAELALPGNGSIDMPPNTRSVPDGRPDENRDSGVSGTLLA
ncbi:ATP-binding protein [Paractinoplanes toevensis]|uniref:ATP-binding protein n=1 Tax=Paractinoplanes toevensis TaxID=571911 RepID=A0A919WDD0_9ACTN|nr:ATP-binding protein [Actinoplanes toevensis]GIM98073.1 hypothetical protein Ato02nite_098660 [Actinoplanes toevensis]